MRRLTLERQHGGRAAYLPARGLRLAALRGRIEGRRLRRGTGLLWEGAGRCGFSLVEMMVSAVLLGALAAFVLPTLGWVSQERRTAGEHQELLEAGANLMDRFTAQAWEQITQEAAAALQLPERLQQRAQAELDVAVEPRDGDPPAKRVRLRIDWTDVGGRPAPPVRISSWVYRVKPAESEEQP